MFCVHRLLLQIKSKTRPGVPDTTCWPYSSFLISSPIDVPPIHAWHCTFILSPRARTTDWIWVANSRHVGDKTSAWVFKTVISMDWRIAIEKVAVLPVPDCAWGITSLPCVISRIARCWIADGFSIWVANSCVGDKTIAIEKVAVLPVPDCAWAITSLPCVIGRIARCWIADGFSKS